MQLNYVQCKLTGEADRSVNADDLDVIESAQDHNETRNIDLVACQVCFEQNYVLTS